MCDAHRCRRTEPRYDPHKLQPEASRTTGARRYAASVSPQRPCEWSFRPLLLCVAPADSALMRALSSAQMSRPVREDQAALEAMTVLVHQNPRFVMEWTVLDVVLAVAFGVRIRARHWMATSRSPSDGVYADVKTPLDTDTCCRTALLPVIPCQLPQPLTYPHLVGQCPLQHPIPMQTPSERYPQVSRAA